MSAPVSSAAPSSANNPPLLGLAPIPAFIASLVASGQFFTAGANYADLLDIDPSAPPPSPFLPDTANKQWEAGFWSRLRSSGPTLPTHPGDLLAIFARPARIAASEARPAPAAVAATAANNNATGPNGVPVRWVCWVRGWIKPGDLGRRKGHWANHAEATVTSFNPEPGRRVYMEMWRLEEDERSNGGNAARQASSQDEFLQFWERDRLTRELRG